MTENEQVGSDLCPLCGGVMASITHAIGASEYTELHTVPSGRLCYGHPAPKMKHDGKLDEFHGWSRGFVEHMDNVDNDISKHRAGIHIHDDYADFECNCIYLDAKQALSLLSWLEQERAALEHFAKEQA